MGAADRPEDQLRAALAALDALTDIIAESEWDDRRGAFIVPGSLITRWSLDHARVVSQVLTGAHRAPVVAPERRLHIVATDVLKTPGDAA